MIPNKLDFHSINNEFLKFRGKKLKSNFFINKEKFDLLLAKRAVTFISKENACYLILEDFGFQRLYFMVDSIQEFQDDLKDYVVSQKILITELVGRKKDLNHVQDVLNKVGFSEYTSLIRMSKPKHLKDTIESENLHQLSIEKKDELFHIFNNFFDKFAEQIPSLEELELLINNNCVYYYTDDQKIQGFIIFETSGYTSHLRYWFVHPDHRNKNIGSQLISRFFNSDDAVKRELFWVIESNENAIKRYKHYGFMEENLHNLILINRNLKYEK